MAFLSALFPPTDFVLLGLILALPLMGAIANGIFGKRLGREAVTLMGLTSVGLAFLFSLIGFFMLSHVQGAAQAAAAAAAPEGVEPAMIEATRFHWLAWDWLELQGVGDGKVFRSLNLQIAFSLDALSVVMCLIITGIGFLIHLYSTKYMETDPGYHRFFSYLNLFIFSMLVLVLGDSLPILFVGWEGVGLCSYLLIGFWFTEEQNAAAGKKAFITNRIGDFGLLVAMGLLAYYVGALDFAGIEANRSALLQPVQIWPVSESVPIARILPEAAAEWVNAPRYANAATLVCLALFLGAMGKSAQFGLHVWLPDAMAGPTPVSALIHAATMVTAGVYLLCRMSAVFVLSPMTMFIVALVGAVTALFAASIALVQNDIKKVLAYSTVSQLGYMFLGVGVGAFTAGFFHVLTHAFFKACLFLGAGSVIHAMHARIHDTDASQDMRNMGGLKKFLPTTFLTFGAAWAAIVGLPLTSGFFSKDEILFRAKTSMVQGPAEIADASGTVVVDNWEWAQWQGNLLYALGFAAAIMTAFYMTRLVIGTFYGEFKGWTVVKDWKDPHAGDHHHHDHHETPGLDMEGPKPHESPWQMTLPLWVLAVLSLAGGFLSAHLLHIAPLDHFLEPVFAGAQDQFETAEGLVDRVRLVEGGKSFELTGAALAIIFAFGGGVGLAYYFYVQQKGEPARALAERFPGVHALLLDKWRIDEAYDETIIGAIDSLADMCVWADKWLVDGILARLSAFLVQLSGTVLRQFQTGKVQAYAAAMTVGMVAVGAYMYFPHANIREQSDPASGVYELSATPGFGYRYRWDLDGDGEWDTEPGPQDQVRFELQANEERTVRVEVRNVFGTTSERSFDYARPKRDLSGGDSMIRVIRGRDGKLRGGDPSGLQPGQLPNLPSGHPQVDPERLRELRELQMKHRGDQ